MAEMASRGIPHSGAISTTWRYPHLNSRATPKLINKYTENSDLYPIPSVCIIGLTNIGE
jgi:hypothetical protein